MRTLCALKAPKPRVSIASSLRSMSTSLEYIVTCFAPVMFHSACDFKDCRFEGMSQHCCWQFALHFQVCHTSPPKLMQCLGSCPCMAISAAAPSEGFGDMLGPAHLQKCVGDFFCRPSVRKKIALHLLIPKILRLLTVLVASENCSPRIMHRFFEGYGGRIRSSNRRHFQTFIKPGRTGSLVSKGRNNFE